jgi:hypothetical protein
MFIRWQSRERNSSQFGRYGEADICWMAVLAETKRVDGKPQQRHIAYLGSITDSAMKIDAQRCHFWDGISARLDALGNQITQADRKKVEAAIAEKVTRLTPTQYKDVARDSARLLGWKWLTEPQRAALQDEAEKYQGNGGELVQRITTALERTEQ